MIRYALRCASGHGFESWFRDSAAYDDQAASGLLSCPHCGEARIEKQIMAPAVALKEDAALVAQPIAMMGEKDREMRAKLRAFHQHLKANAEDVGGGFAEEARKIHYGESDERAIYGVATPPEAQALHDEGIAVLPLPHLPEEAN